MRLRYTSDGIQVEVSDDGPAGPDVLTTDEVGGGAGLTGLRERARLLGGQFEAERCQQGFVIRAFLRSRQPGTSSRCGPTRRGCSC